VVVFQEQRPLTRVEFGCVGSGENHTVGRVRDGRPVVGLALLFVCSFVWQRK
jgi:hypothetical protein